LTNRRWYNICRRGNNSHSNRFYVRDTWEKKSRNLGFDKAISELWETGWPRVDCMTRITTQVVVFVENYQEGSDRITGRLCRRWSLYPRTESIECG
jgi:hypothetical protein